LIKKEMTPRKKKARQLGKGKKNTRGLQPVNGKNLKKEDRISGELPERFGSLHLAKEHKNLKFIVIKIRTVWYRGGVKKNSHAPQGRTRPRAHSSAAQKA